MTDANSTKCPVCGVQAEQRRGEDGIWTSSITCECPNCGNFSIDDQTRLILDNTGSDELRAVLSHAIWRNQQAGKPFEVNQQFLGAAKEDSLPDPATQLDLLILYLGHNQHSSGATVDLPRDCLRAKIGATCIGDEIFIVEEGVKRGLLDRRASQEFPYMLRLTLPGWQRFHEIQRGAVTSRTAFMAMPFGNEEITQMVDNVFRPAVAQTGFSLRRVDDAPKAGLIDDRIRVDIRLSRFLIADLTCENRGAYWEAGYAEGLGKPVIYTCNKYYFEQASTHFDTNHQKTVCWDAANPKDAAEELKATIRNTLPFEAKMEDDPS